MCVARVWHRACAPRVECVARVWLGVWLVLSVHLVCVCVCVCVVCVCVCVWLVCGSCLVCAPRVCARACAPRV